MIYKNISIKLKSKSPSEYKIGDKIFDPVVGYGIIDKITKISIYVNYKKKFYNRHRIYYINGLYLEDDVYSRLFKVDDYDINFEILEK